jgi:hypothetical protein
MDYLRVWLDRREDESVIGSFRVWMMVSERASIGQPARLPPGGFYGMHWVPQTQRAAPCPQGATSPRPAPDQVDLESVSLFFACA